MTYVANPTRYENASFRRCGKSGIVLPPVSLGLWQNFGGVDSFETGRAMIRRAFDRGVTHFDLANNYGPPYGSAEENFGHILRKDFSSHRNELIISSKAGWDMWPGPYGDLGSRKYLIASCDQSLQPLRKPVRSRPPARIKLRSLPLRMKRMPMPMYFSISLGS